MFFIVGARERSEGEDYSSPKPRGRPPLTSEYSVELGFSFPLRIGRNLEYWRYAVLNQDTDYVVVIDGNEGASKSHTAAQIAYFLDIDSFEDTGDFDSDTGKPLRVPTGRKLDLHKQVVFTFEDFKKAVNDLPPYKAIIYDESGRSQDRRKSMDNENIEFNQFMRECRQKNKFIILVFQSFYDMDQYSAQWRARNLLHMSYKWSTDPKRKLNPMIRGFCRFYGENGKSELYNNKYYRQGYKYPFLSNHSFDVKFAYHWVFDHEEYKKIKAEAMEKLTNKKKASCPDCGGSSLRYSHKEELYKCRRCPWKGNPEKRLNT